MKTPIFLSIALLLVAGCVGPTTPSSNITSGTSVPAGKARITLHRNASLMGPRWQVIDCSATQDPAKTSVVCYPKNLGELFWESLPKSDPGYIAMISTNKYGKWAMPAPVYDKMTEFARKKAEAAPRPVTDTNTPTERQFYTISKAEFEQCTYVFRGLDVGVLGRGGELTYDRDPGPIDLQMFNESLRIPHSFRSLRVEAGKWYHLRAQNRGSKIADLELERVD